MWQYTRWLVPHYLNLLKPLFDIRSSSGFSHLRPGLFHISLREHKTQHTQPRGWKEREQANTDLGLAPSARKEKFMTLLCVAAFCGSMSYRESVFERNSHQTTKNADSSSHVGQPGFWVHRSLQSPFVSWLLSLLLTVLFCYALYCCLPSSVDCPVLFSVFPRLLPVSWEISRASPLCGFRA